MKFAVGDLVVKTTGDYSYPGVVVSAFTTSKGADRYVVESVSRDTRGMLHIFSDANLSLMVTQRNTEEFAEISYRVRVMKDIDA